LKSIQRNLTDLVLENLSKSIYEQLDKQSQIFYLLRLVLNENYLSQQKKKLDLIDLNIDEILNTYIGKISIKKFIIFSLFFFQKIIVNQNLVQNFVHLYLII
jgi:hypothetical protein